MPKASPRNIERVPRRAGREDQRLAARGVRKRKLHDTREAIVAAAVRLFDRRGFDATTVDDIAKAAEVSRRTVFRYFPSKEEIPFVDWPDYLSSFRRHLAWKGANEPALAAVRRAALTLADTVVQDIERDPELYRARLSLIMNVPALGARYLKLGLEWEEAIAETVGPTLADDPAADLHARLLAAAVFGALRAVLFVWNSTDCTADLMELTNEALDLLEGGFSSTHGRSRLRQ